MERILLVARNVFRSIVHGRIIYLWFAGLVLMFLQAAPAVLINAGSVAIQTYIRKRAVSGGLNTWSTLCIALSIFLGALVVSSEFNKKTILAIFSRPIRRWEFLIGKWIGVQCFGLLSLGVGLLVSFGLSRYLGAEFETKVLAISLAQTAAAIFLYSGLALAISTLLTPGVAGALTILVVFLPGFTTYLEESTDTTYHRAGVAMNYVIPAGYTSHYSAAIPAELPPEMFRGFGRGGRGLGGPGGGNGGNDNGRGPGGNVPPIPQASSEPPIDYDKETKVLLQNLGYGLVFFGLGCLVFSRRDLKLN